MNTKVIKGAMKDVWDENKEVLLAAGAFVVTVALAYKLGDVTTSSNIEVGLQTIARKTPELTIGELADQCLKGTFDVSKYW